MADDKQNKQIATAVRKPLATPFIFERAECIAPRAWRPSKPTAATVDQITVTLGTVLARIAGSTVTFPMDVHLVFADKTNKPEYILRQPWLSAPGGRGGKPLFVADDDASNQQLADSLASITARFVEKYVQQPAENRIDPKTITHAEAAQLVKAKASGIRLAVGV